MAVGTAVVVIAEAVTPPDIAAEAYAEDIHREVPAAVVRSVVEAPLGIPEGPHHAVARIAVQVEDTSDAADIHREAPVAVVRSVVEAPLGIPEGPHHAVAHIAEQVEDTSDTAGVGPDTQDLMPYNEAVATLLPDEVDTLAPPVGVTSPSHAADIAARWEVRIAPTVVVLRTRHADMDTDQQGKLSVARTAPVQQAGTPVTARIAE